VRNFHKTKIFIKIVNTNILIKKYLDLGIRSKISISIEKCLKGPNLFQLQVEECSDDTAQDDCGGLIPLSGSSARIVFLWPAVNKKTLS
jgi:hypothetical protein